MFTLVLLATALVALVACDDDGDPEPTPTPTPSPGATPTAPDPGAADAIEWGDCRFDVPPGVDVECGDLLVLADRTDPGAGEMRLHFGVFRSPGADEDATPVVYLSGGPGGAALETAALAFDLLFEPLMADRDLVVFDQRGVGLSDPSLGCPEHTAFLEEALEEQLSAEEIRVRAEEALDECRERLAADGVDFSHFNSRASAADLDELREALGYAEWNLYGVSYGSRLALTAMRNHPGGIRSVILDSAYPPDADLYGGLVGSVGDAIDGFFAACERHEHCAQHYPDLEATFYDLVDRLNAEPAAVTVTNPLTGSSTEAMLNGDDLLGTLFLALYNTELLAYMPEIIVAADAGDFEVIGALQGAALVEQQFVSAGMMFAVQCQEAVPFADPGAASEPAEQHERLTAILEANVAMGTGAIELCERWDAGEPPEGAGEPVESEIPSLVLAGSLDHVTPPEWGRRTASHLSNSFFFEFAETGHSVLPHRDCAAEIAQAFLREPATEPDSACLDDVPPLAFTPDDVEVELEPFEGPGYSGLRPEGWAELQPGVYTHALFTSVTQLVQPGANTDMLLQVLANLLGWDEVPEVSQTVSTDTADWEIYQYEAFGRAGDLALADVNGSLLMIELNSTTARQEVYREQVLLPAIEAFELR